MALVSTSQYPGIVLSFILGLLIYFIAPYVGGMNSVILGLLVGIFIGNIYAIPNKFSSGISYTSNKLLELSILFLAFSISLNEIAKIGWQNFLVVALTVLVVLVATVYFAKRFNNQDSTAWLVGFGTAICGSSAIAAVAPAISKTKEAPGISLAVINLIGSVGMLILPALLIFLKVDHTDIGVLLGTTLHSIGNVAGAAYSINSGVGEVAITIKLARIALLSPAVILFTFYVQNEGKNSFIKHLKLPYYLWSFLIITLVTTIFDLPPAFLQSMDIIGKIILTIAMVAIGLKVSFKQLYLSGTKAFGFGLLIFLIQVLAAAVLITIFK